MEAVTVWTGQQKLCCHQNLLCFPDIGGGVIKRMMAEMYLACSASGSDEQVKPGDLFLCALNAGFSLISELMLATIALC